MTTDRPADLVLRGGRIATMDRARSIASAVAVRDGRIVAVGSDASMAGLTGSRTRVVELRGRSVTPGFGDAHVHPVSAGVGKLRCSLEDLRGLDAYLAAVLSYAAVHPDAAWIVGDGWSMADFPGGIPDRDDLDRVEPHRPVYLESRDGHTAWVNSAALEVAGIDATRADPDGGRIERDAEGRPTGALQESAMTLVERLLPPPTLDEIVDGLRLAQTELHALGVTHWQDASVRPGFGEAAYTTLAGRGELTARVVGALCWDRARGTEQIDQLVERRDRTAIGRYAPTSVKFFVDGVIESFTAAMLDPYLDAEGRPTTRRGASQIEPEALRDAVVAVGAQGFQAHCHAIGDRAVREALDAIEAARRSNGPDDTRPHIAHIQVIHPDDLARFARHDVVANAQPFWATHDAQMDRLTIPFLGPVRATWQYPFRSLLDAGATLAMGSDWAVSTASPLLEMEVAVTRVGQDPAGERAPFLPDQRLDLEDALAAFTTGSAWVNHLERDLGTVEVDKTADLVVLDRDLFDGGAGPIGETRVLATFIDGIPVYESATLQD